MPNLLLLFACFITQVAAQADGDVSNVTINSGLTPVYFLNVPDGATLTCSPGGSYTFRSSSGRAPVSATNTNGEDQILWGPCVNGDCIVVVPQECTTCMTDASEACPPPVQEGSTACTIVSKEPGEPVDLTEAFGGFAPLCSNFMNKL